VTTVRFAATARADDGTPQVPATGKSRFEPASSAGPPRGPGGFRVSATRHGVRMRKPVPAALTAASTSTRPEPKELFGIVVEDVPPQVCAGLTVTAGFAVLVRSAFVAAMSRTSCERADQSS